MNTDLAQKFESLTIQQDKINPKQIIKQLKHKQVGMKHFQNQFNFKQLTLFVTNWRLRDGKEQKKRQFEIIKQEFKGAYEATLNYNFD